MKIQRYLYNALEFVALVDDSQCPVDPYVSCYLNGPLAGSSPNTRVRYANELLFVLRYFNAKGISMPDRVASGTLFSSGEYHEFYDRCLLKGDPQKTGVIDFKYFESKQLRNAMVASQRSMAKASNGTVQGRIRRFRCFLEWLYRQAHDSFDVAGDVKERYLRLTAEIKLNEKRLGKNENRHVASPSMSVIPDSTFIKLLSVTHPSSPQNPFKRSKLRNYIIVNMLANSGIRRGALAKLKISDLIYQGSADQISIYRSRNDPSDPRLERPNQKTKAHLSTVGSDIMIHTKFYIDHVRALFPEAIKHDYLFVSESGSKRTAGHPLSLKSINSLFRKISKTLGFHISPHTLRHKWNEIFDISGNKCGIDASRLEDVRKYAMGWTQSSSMSTIYNDKRLAVVAREISKAHQQRIDLLK
jgi:integrase